MIDDKDKKERRSLGVSDLVVGKPYYLDSEARVGEYLGDDNDNVTPYGPQKRFRFYDENGNAVERSLHPFQIGRYDTYDYDPTDDGGAFNKFYRPQQSSEPVTVETPTEAAPATKTVPLTSATVNTRIPVTQTPLVRERVSMQNAPQHIDSIASAVGYVPPVSVTPVTESKEPVSMQSTPQRVESIANADNYNQGEKVVEEGDYDFDEDGNLTTTTETSSSTSTPVATPEEEHYNKVKGIAEDELLRNPEFLQELANLYRKPEDAEEQARRERGAAAMQGVGRVGNAFNALGNLFFVNRGALNQKIPELQTYGDTIDKYRETLDKSRDNYVNFRSKLHQLHLDQLMKAVNLAKTDAERQDAISKLNAYIKTQESIAAKNAKQGEKAEADAKIAQQKYEDLIDPEKRQKASDMEDAKLATEKAREDSYAASSEQRRAAADKSRADAAKVRSGGSGNAKDKGKYYIKEKDGTITEYDINTLRKRASKEGIDYSKVEKDVKANYPGASQEVIKVKSAEELHDQIQKKVGSNTKKRVQQKGNGGKKTTKKSEEKAPLS